MEVYGRIYGIENLLTNMIYVGQTTCDVRKRISEHKCGKQFVDQEIQKYGWEGNFICVVLEECYSRAELNIAEKIWIERLNCQFPNGYNLTNGGNVNCKYVEDVLQRMSKSRKGKKFSQQHKDNMSKANKNKKRTLEQCFNISISRKKILYPNLEKELEKRKLSHFELARRLNVGLAAKTIHHKLNGGVVMDLDTAIAIKEFLGVDIPLEELFKKKDD